MKQYKLDLHSFFCKKEDNRDSSYFKIYGMTSHDFCKRTMRQFLFFLKHDFYIINYHKCMTSCESEQEFFMSLINDIITNTKVYELYDIERSVRVNNDFRKYRRHGINLQTHHTEVNYIYGPNYTQRYAITTKLNYLDAIYNSDLIRDNYKKALEYIKENNLQHLEGQLEELYLNNYIDRLDEVEIVKTVDHLIKQINNGNNKESKQQRVA